MKKPNLKPFSQGTVDNLCGVYCAVNLVHWLRGPLSEEDATDRLTEYLECLSYSASAVERMQYGTSVPEMHRLLRHVRTQQRLSVHRPFPRAGGVALSQLWDELRAFLAVGRRAVVLGIDYGEWSHWSLVVGASPHALQLLDSNRRKRLYRHRCTTRKLTRQRSTLLWPTEIFLVAVDDQPGGRMG